MFFLPVPLPKENKMPPPDEWSRSSSREMIIAPPNWGTKNNAGRRDMAHGD